MNGVAVQIEGNELAELADGLRGQGRVRHTVREIKDAMEGRSPEALH